MIDKFILTLTIVWTLPVALFAVAYWAECRATRQERKKP